MKKHDISYNQALRMSIEIDAEKGICNNSKWKLLQALEDEEKDQISPENIVEYTTTEGEIFNVLKIRKEMSRSSLLSSMIGLPISADLDSCRVSDVTSQHPEVLMLKKQLEEVKLEKQGYKDLLAEKEYQAFEKERNKARNGSGSSAHQILERMVVVYKKAVMESKDKKRIYKEVFWNLERFKNFRQAMYKEFDKSMFPKERSMEDYIRIAERELYYETKNEEFNITDSGRPTNEFKNYIPKYPDDIPPEPPQKKVSLDEETWSIKSAPQIIKAPDVDHDLN